MLAWLRQLVRPQPAISPVYGFCLFHRSDGVTVQTQLVLERKDRWVYGYLGHEGATEWVKVFSDMCTMRTAYYVLAAFCRQAYNLKPVPVTRLGKED